LSREDMQIVACEEERVLAVIRSAAGGQVLCLFNYSDQKRVIHPPLASDTMCVLLDSSGNSLPGSCVTVNAARPETFPTLAPFGVIVYRKEK
ncbi:MAG TPA: alpha amylase C-terminal domain-containing protein, partial [Geobacteraceae bacterium]|nr:alpha amylase C-terminal domain-containing protein [Geobacteraceae bacterium]